MKYRSILIMIFLMCSITHVRAQLSPYLCDENLFPVVAVDSPILFPYVTLTGTTLETGGVLTLHNKSEKRIQYYLVVMEFLDDQGKYLFSAPVYNADKEQHVPFDVAFKPWLLANWPGGQMASIPARSKSAETFGTKLVALTCPASVRISVIWLKYDDGKEFKYISENLSLSTSTQEEPIRIKNIKNARKWAPITVAGTLQVDQHGRVKISNTDNPSDDLREWMNREFSGWNFTPAWLAGKPVPSRIPFMFILADNNDPRTQVEALKKRGMSGPLLLFAFQE
jgi:hypothetical protein